MIRFSIHTYKAEINAMPCPPDEFEVIISLRTTIYSNSLVNQMANEVMERFAANYCCSAGECKMTRAFVIRLRRFDSPKPNPWTVHDMILSDIKCNMDNTHL